MNADWVTVKEEGVGITDQTYGEAITTLMEAWSVHQKTEGNPTLLKRSNYAPAMWGPPFYHYQYERNAVCIIQSSINTMPPFYHYYKGPMNNASMLLRTTLLLVVLT